MKITNQHISIFWSLFKGRTDVFAKRWEKNGKSGYMPAYDVDWNKYKKHKAQGGSFKDFEHKKPLPLTEKVIYKHLTGQQMAGIYPLLKNNTSCFIAADFDKENWMEECKNYLNICNKYNIPAYLERSRSGNGGHVWIFFKQPYPAWKSRKIAFFILREAGIISDFEKDGSFDRLFPNQDYHSGKGFGNLIALPLQGKAVKSGNTCFINHETGKKYPDQWSFLEQITRLSSKDLNEIYKEIYKDSDVKVQNFKNELGHIEIILDSEILMNKNQITPTLTSFLREQLNFVNSDYLVKKNLGRSTYQTDKYFKLIDEQDQYVKIPRGFLSDLIQFMKEQDIAYEINDQRRKLEPVTFKSSIELYSFQSKALKPTKQQDFGVLVAPPGSGKTIMGLELIARKRQPALIIVHRQQLFDQWIERIQSFLGIPKKDIGRFSGSHKELGNKITVGMIQTLKRNEESEKILDSFGTIIVDECHHIPAKTFREAIVRFNSYYLYGLTATPMRKNNDESLIYVYVGKILHEIKSDFLNDKKSSTIHINIKETELQVPFDYQIDQYETLSRILVYDTRRNQQIVHDIVNVINDHKSILLLTERKAHIQVLNLYLKDKFETITLSGDDSKKSQQSKIKQIKEGHFQIVLSTGQFFGEGMDIDRFDCLFLVYPFAFKGKLIQYIGRIMRSDKVPIIYDYRDRKIKYFEKLFKKRNKFYDKIRKANQITLNL